jgi:hypothetical protein
MSEGFSDGKRGIWNYWVSVHCPSFCIPKSEHLSLSSELNILGEFWENVFWHCTLKSSLLFPYVDDIFVI